MKTRDFLCEFGDEEFPSSVGPSIGIDQHDPPWTKAQLKQMERQGLIVMSLDDESYRLTLKATKIRDKQRKSAESQQS